MVFCIIAFCLGVDANAALFGSKHSREYRKLRDEAEKAIKVQNLDLAEDLLLKALVPARQYGENDGRYVTALREVVDLLTFRKKYTQANPLAAQMVSSALKRYTTNSIEYASALYEHGDVFLGLRDFQTAEQRFRVAEALARSQTHAYSVPVGYCLGGTARALVGQGRIIEALPLFSKALDLMGRTRTDWQMHDIGTPFAGVQEAVFKPRFQDVAELTYDQVMALQRLRRWEDAKVALEKLRKLITLRKGKNHSMHVPVLIQLAINQDVMDEIKEAENYYLEAVRIAKSAKLSKEGQIYLLANFYRFYFNIERVKDAEQLKQQLLKLGVAESALVKLLQ